MPPESPSVSELTESYETADQFTREVAQFRSAVAVPANNELGYAGHHQALDGQEQISKPDGVRKAKNTLQDGEADSGRRPEYALFGDELRLTLWAKDVAAD